MMIFINQNEYIATLSPTAGIRLQIHRQDLQPFPEDDGMDVSPGLKAAVKVSLVGIYRYIFFL